MGASFWRISRQLAPMGRSYIRAANRIIAT